MDAREETLRAAIRVIETNKVHPAPKVILHLNS